MLNATRAEAERLLGISEKLLQNRDLVGSREFAVLAQEAEPLLEGSDQIVAIVDVLRNAEKRVNNNNLDWYSILQIESRCNDIDLIKKQYRRLALLLHPDKNRFHFSDHAFKLVADAWAVFSDPIKKAHYDKTLTFYSRVDLSAPAPPSWVQQQEKLVPVRRAGPGSRPSPVAREEVAAEENSNSRRRNSNSSNSSAAASAAAATFWTACPYCYRLFEYPKVYEECCLKCVNCDRSFHGVEVSNLPPIVPGQEAYYCCWGFFPMGFVAGNNAEKEGVTAEAVAEEEEEEEPVPVPAAQVPMQAQSQAGSTFPNWMPVTAQSQPPPAAASLPNWMPVGAANGRNNAMPEVDSLAMPSRATRRAAAAVAAGLSNGVPQRGSGTGQKKRGRPRKYPL